MTETLDGRHIVVTGGTGALGGAVVGKLLEQGAVCHVPNAHAAAPPHFPFAAHDRVRLAHNVDLSDSTKVEAFYNQVTDLWGSVHLAGGFAMAPVEKIESASFAEMMDTNARTTFLCCRAAIRSMLTSGTAGRIVNVTARAGLDPRRGSGMVAYAASKAAVAAMTVAMAEELKHKGILVNAVAPSTLDTPANRADMPDADFTKWVSLEAAAEAIAYLASPTNMAMSGTLVPLYGRA
ncbi:SDR family NAD(P)-dependent oxidoreductase [Mesorhizobium sp. M4B.F.Ca.ET.190.01.1.1]|uniref:SDR family NAD(P)-dependent oxidoreductase n=1 Tax=unclassified Mesorhizobium TaxID=325217 RepID=UPI000FE8F7C9|nr:MULTISPECIES: SDR family NAD(P)-dependent oxidoreductase [unclassified Mesorhizobium]RWA59637.1 MAG: SDR family NAD(P)-dependent oxidoreductase [Mesorhizobium sp.]RWC96803.1 MAG: SDR family NAD(P)-dependent oxidoreductase [Mesorhizobium sp.]RWF62469.1 MAG: SDR family NAD(P)-dependent oxidoreductase [Mesorhizobium sp.]TGR09150.1 SDR family NAD(P)-dependent oxidoreductase [Mesorhizobium sp. M4B.F.Ca.ET.200.01.1.1]TGS18629.1 SDR family NAD(P)-dependent oxidoreductase [Mesorhizobium sp. M4B.F.C